MHKMTKVRFPISKGVTIDGMTQIQSYIIGNSLVDLQAELVGLDAFPWVKYPACLGLINITDTVFYPLAEALVALGQCDDDFTYRFQQRDASCYSTLNQLGMCDEQLYYAKILGMTEYGKCITHEQLFNHYDRLEFFKEI